MKIPTMTSPLPGFPGRVFSFNRRPVLTAMLGLLLGWDASLQAQSLWTNTISGSWGNGTNWSPVGIPNATNAVVTLSNININCLNTPENIALWTSGPTNFPYKFGTLNLGTGNCGSDTANDQLMAVVTSGTPVINLSSGSCYFYSVIYGNQGFNKTGAGNMTFRYGQSQVFTGNVGVLGGELQINADASLGNTNNNVTITNGAQLNMASTISSTYVCTLAPSRTITLAGTQATIAVGTATETLVIPCLINENPAGSGLLQNGGGTLVLSNANTFTGPMTITAGTNDLANPNAVQFSTMTVNGGLLMFDQAVTGNAFTFGGLAGTAVGNNVALQNNAATPAAITLTVGGNNASTSFAGNLTGPGSLVKTGAGSLGCAGTNSYTGSTTIQQGRLIVPAGSTGNGAYSVVDGATNRVKVSVFGQTLTNSSLTLGVSAGATMEFDNTNLANPTVAMVRATNLTVNGTIKVNIYGTTFSIGTINLLAYTTKTGTGTWSLNSLPAGVAGNLNDTGSLLQLNITAVPNTSLFWRGNVGSVWDTNNAANNNWFGLPTSAAAYYTEIYGAPAVTFDDTATGSTAITLGVAVKPASVTLSNNSAVYSLTGAGGISGVIGLTKNGTGAFTIGTSNNFSGTLTVNAGTLGLSGLNTNSVATTIAAGTLALSGGNNRLSTNTAVTMSNNGKLDLGGNSQTLAKLALTTTNNTMTITNGTLTVQSANDLNLTPAPTANNQTNTLNMSGLASFTYNASAKNVVVGGGGANGNILNWILSAGSNSLTALYLNLGVGGSGGSAPYNLGAMFMGQTNVFNLGSGLGNAIFMGGYRGGNNNLTYQAGLSNPGLRLRASDGVSRAGDITVSQGSSGTSTLQINNLDFGVADVLAGNLILADNVQGSAGVNVTGTMSISGGSLNVTNIILGRNTAAAPSNIGNLTGSFTQGGGTVTALTLTFGLDTSATTPTGTLPNYVSTYALNGGTLAAQTVYANPDGWPVRNTSVHSLVWSNGTIRNYNSVTPLLISNVTVTATATNAGRIFWVDAALTNTVLGQINQGTAGALPVIKAGPGTLDLQGASDNAWFSLNVSNGVVLLDKQSTTTPSVHAIGSGLTLNGGSVILAGNGGMGGDQIYDGNIVTLNSGTFDLNGQTETIGGLAGAGGTLADASGGSATLTVNLATGTNYTSGATIAHGNLIIGLATGGGSGTQILTGADSRSTETTTINSGTLQIGNGGTGGSLAGSGVTVNAPGFLAFANSGSLNFAGGISGNGNVAQNGSGTLTLSGSDYHTGSTLVNAGTLAVPSGALTVGGSVITVASGAVFNTTQGSGYYVAGNQTLNGSGTVTGGYLVGSGATNSGTLSVNGSVTLLDGSVFDPGAVFTAGTVTVNGNLTNSGNNELIYNLAATTTPGGGINSLLVVSGNLDLGNNGNTPTLILHGTPVSGTYTLATFGTFSGNASALQVQGSTRYTYTPQISGNRLVLVVAGNGGNLVWQGDGSGNAWDANDSANVVWFNLGTSAPDFFNTGDNTLFNDASTNPMVNINTTVLPASLTVNATSNYVFAGSADISGPIALTKTNSGTLEIQNNNTFTGPVNLNGGVVSVAAVAASGTVQPLGLGSALNFNGGTFQYTGPAAGVGEFGRSITLGANGGTIDQESSSGIYLFVTNTISGAGSLTKTGPQQLILGDVPSLTGSNSYAGGTIINGGNLQIRHAAALGTNSVWIYPGGSLSEDGGFAGAIMNNVVLKGGNLGGGPAGYNFAGSVTLTTNSTVGGNNLTVSGPITGASALDVTAGTVTLLNSANNYSGGTVITAGTLQLGTNGASGWIPAEPTGVALTNNGTLSFDRADTNTLADRITGAGGVNQSGSGITILTASNDFTGAVHVNAGSLRAAANNAAGSGNVYLPGGNNYGTLELAGDCVLANGLVQLPMHNAHTPAHIRNVSGTNDIQGMLDIEPGGTYWDIASDGGYLIIDANITASANDGGGWRTLCLNGAAGGRLNGVYDQSLISPPANILMEILGGSWTLGNNNNYGGNTTVDAGATLLVDNTNQITPGSATGTGVVVVNGRLGGDGFIGGPVNLQTGGNLAPGWWAGTNTSVLTLNSNLTLGGSLLFNLNKSLVQSNDYVVVNGLVLTNTAAGTLTVTNFGPALTNGDTFTLFSQAVSNGAALNVAGGGAGVTWSNNLALDGSITVLSVTPPLTINTNPATADFQATVVSGGLYLSWAPDHKGWQLYSNSVGLNATGSWFPVPGSASETNTTIIASPANANVFFQLRYP